MIPIQVKVVGIGATQDLLTNIIRNTKTESRDLTRRTANKLVKYARINIKSNRKFTIGKSDVADTIKAYRVSDTTWAVSVFHPAAKAIEEGRRALYPNDYGQSYYKRLYLRGIGFRTINNSKPLERSKPKWFMRNAIDKVTNEMNEELTRTGKNIINKW